MVSAVGSIIIDLPVPVQQGRSAPSSSCKRVKCQTEGHVGLLQASNITNLVDSRPSIDPVAKILNGLCKRQTISFPAGWTSGRAIAARTTPYLGVRCGEGFCGGVGL